MKKIKDIMTQEPVCCEPDTPLPEVAKLMCNFNCGEIPVVDQQNKPIGVVTDRDIACRAVALGKNVVELTAEECMSAPCVTVTLETSLEECCRVLEENQIRRVPVVDEQGVCCGIVAQADIALNAPKEKTAELLQEISKAA